MIHYGLTGLFYNPSLFAALLSCLIAQVSWERVSLCELQLLVVLLP